MKLRILLAIFLALGMLFAISSFAYADDPPNADPPPPQDNPDPPADPSLQVDIQIQGDNPEVNVEVEGDNPNLNLGVNGNNPNVYLNGRNINKPTVVVQGGGYDGRWVIRKINEAFGPLLSWMNEYSGKAELTASGLAKVILLAQDSESKIETQISLTDEYGKRLTNLEAANLDQRVGSLETEQKIMRAYTEAQLGYLSAYYNRMLIIIIGVFSVLVLGLGAGLVLLWRRR